MRQLLMNCAYTRLKNAAHLLFITVIVITVGGCAAPGALVPGQTELAQKDIPLAVFTLQIYHMRQQGAENIYLLNNTTNKVKSYLIWRDATKKQQQQDFSNQIIALQLDPGTYTIKWFGFQGVGSYLMKTYKQFTIKDNTVSYIGNIRIFYGGLAGGVGNFVSAALTGTEDINVNVSYNDNYGTDIIKIRNMFPCLNNVNIENQF